MRIGRDVMRSFISSLHSFTLLYVSIYYTQNIAVGIVKIIEIKKADFFPQVICGLDRVDLSWGC